MPEDKDGDGSSTSSFSFRDLLSPNRATNNDNVSQVGDMEEHYPHVLCSVFNVTGEAGQPPKY